MATSSFNVVARNALERNVFFQPQQQAQHAQYAPDPTHLYYQTPTAAGNDLETDFYCMKLHTQALDATTSFRRTHAAALQRLGLHTAKLGYANTMFLGSVEVTPRSIGHHCSPDILAYALAVMRHDLEADASVYQTNDYFVDPDTQAVVPLDVIGLAQLRCRYNVHISFYEPGDGYCIPNQNGDGNTTIDVSQTQAYHEWRSTWQNSHPPAHDSSSSFPSISTQGNTGSPASLDSAWNSGPYHDSPRLDIAPFLLAPEVAKRPGGSWFCCGVEACDCQDPYDYRYEG